MIDLPMQSTGMQQSHTKGHHYYSKLKVVTSNTSPPLTPVRSNDHVITTPLAEGEAIQFDKNAIQFDKNDDGSLMLPFKGVEMNQLSYSVTQHSSEEQLNVFLQNSSFSHEQQHLDQQQQHNNFDQRQLSVDQQQQQNNHQVTNQTTEPH